MSDVLKRTYGLKTEKTLKFDEAMTRTGFGRYNFIMTILCGLISMSYVLETVGFSFILPAAECDLQLSLTQKGWVATIPFIGLIVSSQFWGYMADTRGRRLTLIISLAIGSLCSVVSSFSYNLAIFAFFKLCSAAMISASNVIVFPYYGEFTPKAYLDRMISVISSIIIFSSTVTTLIAWGVLSLPDFRHPIDFLGIDFRPWRLMIICFSLPVMLATFCLIFAPESPKYLMSQGKNEEALSILRRMYQVNTRDDQANFSVKAVVLDDLDHLNIKEKRKSPFKSLWNQTVPLFKMPHLKYVMIILFLNFGVYGSTTPYVIWLPDIIERFYVGLDSENSGNKLFCELMRVRSELEKDNEPVRGDCSDFVPESTYHMMLAVTTIMGIFNMILAVCMKWVQKKIVFLVMLSTGCFSTLSLLWIRSPWTAWTCLVVFQCCGVLRGILLAYAVELIPTNYRVMAVSLFLIFGRFGVVAGTNTIGYLMEVNCEANFIGYGIILLVCVALCALLPGKPKEAPPTDIVDNQEVADSRS